MYKLKAEQAQSIVNLMMKDIPYNINIMNEQGIIIGSGNKARVGTVHQGAVEALSTGKMIEVWKDGRYEKQGTNEPILIDNERVGVIGISGNPDEVRPFCNIVKTTVSLLIEQGTLMKNPQQEAKQRQAFLEMLLSHHGSYSEKLCREAMHYQIDLTQKSIVVYMKGYHLQESQLEKVIQYTEQLVTMDEDVYVLIVQDPNQVLRLIRTLLKMDKKVLIGLGKLEANIADSYHQAKAAMNVLLALRLPSRIASYEKSGFLVKLAGSDLTDKPNVVGKLEDNVDLLETLRCFIRNQCSMSLTADELNIHRNTLQYRLKRIRSLTGKDPRNTIQLFELMYGLLTLNK